MTILVVICVFRSVIARRQTFVCTSPGISGLLQSSALYEAPFSSLHADGPEALFAGKSNVIEGIFEKLEALHPEPLADAG